MAKKSKKQECEPLEAVTEVREETSDETTEEELDPMVTLQNEVEVARAEASNNWDLYLRERADLENARKRHQRDKEDVLRYANDRLLKEMIPVLDNLERAVGHAGEASDDKQGLLEGVNMTINQFRKVLEDFGVKAIVAVGATFDPNLHQAMGHIESTEQAPNTVITEFQRGYLLNDRLLRPAMVMLAKAPVNEAKDSDAKGSASPEE